MNSAPLVIIIFSKDRPLQLEATIGSFFLHCRNPGEMIIRIIMKASNTLYEQAYRELEEEYAPHSGIKWIKEIDFRRQLLQLLPPFDYVLWLVDDNIFIRDFDLNECRRLLETNLDALGYSLRLGENTTYCYPLDRRQELPEFKRISETTCKYGWTTATHDFGYPLELSSSLYRTRDLLPLLESVHFFDPNSLEAALAVQAGSYRTAFPYLLCGEKSVTFCNPVNKVQTTMAVNRAGNDGSYSPEALLELFNKGKRIDPAPFDGFIPNACHQELPLTFKESSNANPKVSVIIPCYNQAHFLAEAVESIVSQSYGEWECIIINDGSPDNSSDVARSLIHRYPKHAIRLLEKENGGVADARNAGIAAARGEWVLPLDSDDLFLPSFLKKAMATVHRDNSADILFANVRQFGAINGSWVPADYSDELMVEENCIPYAALYRKKLWEKVGGYNRVLGKGNLLEDWEFWIRLSVLHPHVVRIPEFLFRYRIHQQNSYYSVIQPNFKVVHAMILTANPIIHPREQIVAAWNQIAVAPPELRNRIKAALERYPEEALPHFWRGLIHEGDGHLEQAIDEYELARRNSSTEDWQISFCLRQAKAKAGAMTVDESRLLPNPFFAQQAAPKSYSSMSVDGETQFESELRTIFDTLRPSTIIETGTYLGQGTSSIIWRALRDFGISSDFTTIEVNPEHHKRAKAYFIAQGMKIRAELGISVPRNLLPDKGEITDKFIANREYEGIYYDHHEAVRAELYFSETDFNVNDDLLYMTMQRYAFKPEFVLLDSAGHMGFIEFQYFMSLIQGDCTLMLDDIHHCKHYKTLQTIKQDPRFEIIVESREKFGFCIARYTHVNSLLYIRTDLIGDNVIASAMLPHLLEKYPGATITVLCQEQIAELYAASPQVHRIIGFNQERAYAEEAYRDSILKELRELHADLCLNTLFSRTPLADLFAVAAKARISVAQEGDLFNIPESSRSRNNGYYTHLLPNVGAMKSELQRHRDFLAGIGIASDDLELPFWLFPEDVTSVDQLFRESGLIPEKTIALFAGAQDGIKRYEGYGAALAGICREQGFTVVALGAKKDYAINQLNLDATGVRTLNLSGATTLRQSGVIISRCRLAVGADTGLAHIACAVGTENVITLGGWHWGRFLPYSPLTSVVSLPLACYGCQGRCRYAQAHCISGIAPETIAQALRRTIAAPSSTPRLFAQGSDRWQPTGEEPHWVPAESILNDVAPACSLIYA